MEFEPTKEDLQQYREWLSKMPHLIQDYDDQFLSAIIRAAKGSLQKAKVYLENVNAFGSKCPEFFGTLDPLHPQLQEYLSVWLTFPLPKKTPDGSTVIMVCLNTRSNDPSKSHKPEYYRYLCIILYILLWENELGSGKWKLFFDYKGFVLEHLRDMTPMAAKKIIEVGEMGVPARIQAIAFFNVPTFVEWFCTLFKKAAKAKLTERFFIYNSIDHITDHIPRKMLPKEYGGCEESVFVLHDNFKRKAESYRTRFLEETQKMRELDHLRPRTTDEIEMVGTFRHLNNVD